MTDSNDVAQAQSYAGAGEVLVIGSVKQSKFIGDLVARAKLPSVIAVCSEVLGRSEADLTRNPPSASDARRVIEHLQSLIKATLKGSNAGLGATAAALRRYAEGEEAPEDLDGDSLWIVSQLQRSARAIAVLTGDEVLNVDRRRGYNAGRRIEVEHLLKFFKSWDNLADAFKVTVPTAKAWGQYVPENRVYEAEVRTNGFVRVPRNQHGRVV